MGDAPAFSVDNPKKPKRIVRERLSVRRPIVVAAYGAGLCLLTFLCRGMYLYWNDVKIVNFLAAWIPFVLSVLLAFVPEHDMTKGKKLAWRSGVIGIGFLWSAVLWHQQVVTDTAAKEDQERIVTKAVSESNHHSDEQIGNVRDDLKGVKGDLSSTTRNITNALSQSGIDISKSIANANKRQPTETAKLVISFYPEIGEQLPILTHTEIPDKDGNYSVDLMFTNTAETAAESVDVWVQICDFCFFVTEPAGFDKPNGLSEHARHKFIQMLTPGTSFEKFTVAFKPSELLKRPNTFQLGFRYSCKTCGKLLPSQTLQVIARQFPMGLH